MSPAKPTPAPAMGPRDYIRLDGSQVWLPTGQVRIRVGWFGIARLEIEEWTEIDTRPAGAVYSPSWWQKRTRWVRAKRGEHMPLPTLTEVRS